MEAAGARIELPMITNLPTEVLLIKVTHFKLVPVGFYHRTTNRILELSQVVVGPRARTQQRQASTDGLLSSLWSARERQRLQPYKAEEQQPQRRQASQFQEL